MTSGRKRIRDEARRARNNLYRQHIFAAAEKVFADSGFEAAKVQDIAELAGLSMGTIYAIFPSKLDLFRAILDARGQEILDLVQQVTARNGTAQETLDSLIEAYIDYFVEHPDFLRMHLRLGGSWVMSPSDGETRAQHWREIHELQADIFRRGIAEGTFIEDDPAFLAKLFSAMDQVLLAEWVGEGMKRDRAYLVKRLQDLAARAFRRPARRLRGDVSQRINLSG
jgi:AcrR family transcriptional regulator